MGLLDQLWDDTVAGPTPDTGLGKLRKQHTFSFRSTPSKEAETLSAKDDTGMKVTRSIMILKPSSASLNETPPASPTSSTSPIAGGRSESFRFRRKSASDAYERASGIGSSRSPPPPPYDV